MPYPARVDYDTIVETAWNLVETEGGIDRVSLSKLAAALGIKAPSLYRYIENKAALLRAVNQVTNTRLFAALTPVLSDDTIPDPATRLAAAALALRDFAHANPVTYTLGFTTIDPEVRPEPEEQEQVALPFQGLIAEIAGDAQSLAALRGFLALVHGFVMLELHDQLRRGGDLDQAFAQSVDAYLRGWSP